MHGHPFHRHATVRYFMARRNGRPVGRIAALINENHNLHWNEKVGFFGLYEVLNDREASDALLEAAEAFVRQQGMSAIRGPMNFSTNEECGLLVDGWNGPPLAMMTYNPRYYVDLIEEAATSKQWTSGLPDRPHPVQARWHRHQPQAPPRRREGPRADQRDRPPFQFQELRRRGRAVQADLQCRLGQKLGLCPLDRGRAGCRNPVAQTDHRPRHDLLRRKRGPDHRSDAPLPDLNQALIRPTAPRCAGMVTMAKMLYWWKVRGWSPPSALLPAASSRSTAAWGSMRCWPWPAGSGHPPGVPPHGDLLDPGEQHSHAQMAEILDGKVYRTTGSTKRL